MQNLQPPSPSLFLVKNSLGIGSQKNKGNNNYQILLVFKGNITILFLVKTYFKFIGKVQSQASNFLKNSVFAHFTWFCSKTNRITTLYTKTTQKQNKTCSLIHSLSRFLDYWPLQNRAFSPTSGKTFLKRCNLKTLRSNIFFLHFVHIFVRISWIDIKCIFYDILRKKVIVCLNGLKGGPFKHSKT